MYPDLIYELALCNVPYIGHVHAKQLVEVFGSASAIFSARISDLERVEHIGQIKARSIKSYRDFHKVEKEISFIEKYNIKPLFLTHAGYPQRLLNCYDPLTMLFYKGNANLNASRMVAIVGTRNNTDYGKSFTEKLVRSLSVIDIVVVSGLAFGIDTIAHKCSLKYGIPTIGVVGHGLDTIYPPENKGLAKQMLKDGGLLTEFKSNTKPDKHNFPSRNRVVAGMSDATIIIESGIKGGSNITANLAWSYNKDVFAVPGRSTDVKSAGCNRLIKDNKAILLDDPDHFIEVMGWKETVKSTGVIQKQLFDNLTENENAILALLTNHQEMGIDAINFSSGLNSSSVATALLDLEMKGLVKCMPGKRFKLSE